MKKFLLIANEEDMPKGFMKAIKSYFIEHSVIYDEVALQTLLANDVHDYKTIFIQIELTWPYSSGGNDFNGFELAEQELRLNNVRTRIVFLSPQNLDFFNNLENANAQILLAPGSGFLQLGEIKMDDIEHETSIPPLTDIVLQRVQNSYCTIDAKIDTKMHDLKPAIKKIREEGKPFEEIEAFAKSEILKLTEWYSGDDIKRKAFKEYANNLEIRDDVAIRGFGMKSISELIESFNNSSSKGKNKKGYSIEEDIEQRPWKVLILDDNPDQLTRMVVGENGEETIMEYKDILKVKEVIIVTTVEDAKEKIKKDQALFNEITVIISDLDLRDGNGMAQKEQGEDFLKWLETRPHTHQAFLISHLNRSYIRKQLIRKFRLKCNDFYKSELGSAPDEFTRFIDSIYEKGDDNWELLMNRPYADRWSKGTNNKLPLKVGYKMLRNHSNYNYFEVSTTEQSNMAIQHFELDGVMPELNFSNSEYNYNHHGIQGLLDYLIARRVVIWLYEVKNIKDKLQICKIIKASKFDKTNEIIQLRKNEGITKTQTSIQLKKSIKITQSKQYLKLFNKYKIFPIQKTINEFETTEILKWVRLNDAVLVEMKEEGESSLCKVVSVEEYERKILKIQNKNRKNEQITVRRADGSPTNILKENVVIVNSKTELHKFSQFFTPFNLITKLEPNRIYPTKDLIRMATKFNADVVEINEDQGISNCKIVIADEKTKNEEYVQNLDLPRINEQITYKVKTRNLVEEVKLVGSFVKINKKLGIDIKPNNKYSTVLAVHWAEEYNKRLNGKNNESDETNKIQLIENEIKNGVPICVISSMKKLEDKNKEPNYKQLFLFLALTLASLPSGILVEEKSWLENHTEWKEKFMNEDLRKLRDQILVDYNQLIKTDLYQQKLKNL